jgi:hypothetical protein
MMGIGWLFSLESKTGVGELICEEPVDRALAGGAGKAGVGPSLREAVATWDTSGICNASCGISAAVGMEDEPPEPSNGTPCFVVDRAWEEGPVLTTVPPLRETFELAKKEWPYTFSLSIFSLTR